MLHRSERCSFPLSLGTSLFHLAHYCLVSTNVKETSPVQKNHYLKSRSVKVLMLDTKAELSSFAPHVPLWLEGKNGCQTAIALAPPCCCCIHRHLWGLKQVSILGLEKDDNLFTFKVFMNKEEIALRFCFLIPLKSSWLAHQIQFCVISTTLWCSLNDFIRNRTATYDHCNDNLVWLAV